MWKSPVTVLLDIHIIEVLERIAERQNKSLSSIIRKTVEKGLSKAKVEE